MSLVRFQPGVLIVSNWPPPPHEHKFIHGGIKYEVQEWKLAGSGARPVYYFDWFYCEVCLENKYQKLEAETDSYSKVIFGATPKGSR